MSSRVAKRYARALLELAAEHNQLEQWGAELSRLAAHLEAPELAARLASPELAEPARIEAVAKVAEHLGLSFPLRSFAVVLARHGRLAEAGAVAESYQELLDQRLGRVRARLTFAMAPSASDTARVVAGLEALTGKRVIATVRVESALLGGAMAELEGRTYDASLATQLKQAQRRLTL